MTYRMQEPCHNMDSDFLEALAAAEITIVDLSGAPHNVVFEHADEEVLRDFWRENWGDEDGQPYILLAAGLPCACVETVHRVRVDFEYGRTDEEVVDNTIFALANKAGAKDMQVFGGNAACAPYAFCEHESLEAAHVLGRQLVDFLLEAGCKVTS